MTMYTTLNINVQTVDDRSFITRQKRELSANYRPEELKLLCRDQRSHIAHVGLFIEKDNSIQWINPIHIAVITITHSEPHE